MWKKSCFLNKSLDEEMVPYLLLKMKISMEYSVCNATTMLIKSGPVTLFAKGLTIIYYNSWRSSNCLMVLSGFRSQYRLLKVAHEYSFTPSPNSDTIRQNRLIKIPSTRKTTKKGKTEFTIRFRSNTNWSKLHRKASH